jgi:hypothetical protein
LLAVEDAVVSNAIRLDVLFWDADICCISCRRLGFQPFVGFNNRRRII